VITFDRLKYLSFFLSGVYLLLLTLWLTDGPDTPRAIFGWTHGIGWIVMSALCIAAVHKRVIPMWLAVMVAVVGGVGPFAGSIGFVVCERRAAAPKPPLERGMV
jgi:hypothetical protein